MTISVTVSKSAEDSQQKLLNEIQALEKIVASWDDANHKNTVKALKNAIDDLHREAFSRLIKSLRANPAALAALKEALSDELLYAVLRHHELIKPSLQERVELALDLVRPMLASHGGNVELVKIEDAVVHIRLLGTCNNCPAADLTFTEGIEKAVKEACPEIKEIVKSKISKLDSCDSSQMVQYVSPFARSEKPWQRLAMIDEIPENTIKAFSIEDKSLLLFRRADKLFCYFNSCAHLGLPLDQGELDDDQLVCPFHRFRYSLSTGECLTAPEVQLESCAVRVAGNNVEVRLP